MGRVNKQIRLKVVQDKHNKRVGLNLDQTRYLTKSGFGHHQAGATVPVQVQVQLESLLIRSP